MWRPLILPVLFFALCSSALAEERVVLLSNEYAPYVYSNGRQQGFYADLVVAAFDAVGVKTKIEYRPWRRCSLLVECGEAAGAFPFAPTEKRSRFALFSRPVWRCRNVFFYLRGRMGNYDFKSLEALQGHRIAGTSGHYYEDVFKKAKLQVDYAPGEASGVRKVWEMRAAFFAEDEIVGWTLINRIFPQYRHLFASTPTPWNVNPLSIMFSKKYPGTEALRAQFDKGLQVIRTNGTFEAILGRYISDAPVMAQ